jgi:hypothetical protein
MFINMVECEEEVPNLIHVLFGIFFFSSMPNLADLRKNHGLKKTRSRLDAKQKWNRLDESSFMQLKRGRRKQSRGLE